VLLNCAQSAAQLIEQVAEPRSREPTRRALLTYGIGAQILRDLRVGRMRLMTTPRKMPSMAGWALEVTGYESPAPAAAK
jgi:3,4-dihydroxy 2-butanone 4-phosphate synthase/GTP cyclohydrolase II